MFKRVFDVVLSITGMIVLSPFFLIVPILIKGDSRGPIFFKQDRVGLGGEIFRIYKFRTMAEDADKRGPELTMKNDPRITNIGHLLRWLKIDEFPQLINILMGNLSFVGPRPEIPSVTQHYSTEQQRILSVKPGVTGPGQIRGRDELEKYPDGVDVEEHYVKYILPDKLKRDLIYVESHSFAGDLRFIFQTIFITFVKAVKLEYVIRNKDRMKIFGVDMLCVVISYCAAFLLRFEGDIPGQDIQLLLYSFPILMLCRGISFPFFGLYEGIGHYAGIYDVVTIVKAVSISSILFIAFTFFIDLRHHSRTIFLIDWMLLNFLLFSVRFRSLLYERSKRERIADASRVLIIGAGDAGELLLRQMDKYPEKYIISGFIDDDPVKHHSMIHGIPILGNLDNFSQIAKTEEINDVFIAVPTIRREKIRGIVTECKKMKIGIKVVPTIGEVMDKITQFEKIREVKVEDLLGRKSIKLDTSKISEFLSNKVILVTGAAGTIGSELARQIARFNPSQLILFDRNENGMFFIEIELSEDFPGLSIVPAIGDVTDTGRLDEAFRFFKPEVVFHAAAHKHVPLMEKNPAEAVKNNISGTKNVAFAAQKYGAEKFVLISTDKAVNPTSIMGMTKKIAEIVIHRLSKTGNTRFATVRFGNVLGSHGSVVPVFKRQIEGGGPIRITHPDIVRYFMTIHEAAQLVIQAGAMGNGGEIFLLNMGEPVKIIELARDLILQSGLQPGKDIKIVFDGLRPGEKMYEELYDDGLEVVKTEHDKIMIVKSEDIDDEKFSKKIDEIEKLAKNGEAIDWRKELEKVIS